MEGFHGTLEELLSQFALSRRLAMRVGALLALRVSITPTVLEEAAKDSELASFLLRPELLQKARELTTEELKKLWEGSSCPLVVVEKEEEKVIGFEEELLAAQGFQTKKEGAETLLQPVTPSVKGNLFSPQEVERWKLDLLTTKDSGKKCEALRRISYSALPPQEKALLALHALQDASREVKQEVASFFATLGLSSEITENLRICATGSVPERAYALERLSQFLRQASSGEVVLAFHFLVKLLEEEDVPAVIRWLCQALETAVSQIQSFELLLDFAERLVRLLPKYPEVYEPLFGRLFRAMAGQIPKDQYSAFLEKQLQMTKDGYIASFLALLAHELSLSSKEFLAKTLAELLSQTKESDSHRYRLGRSLAELGEASIPFLFEAYHKAKLENKRYILQILDHIGEKSEDPQKIRQIGSVSLSVLEEGLATLKQRERKKKLWKHPKLPQEVKEQVAQRLVLDMGKWNTGGLEEYMEVVFENLAEVAIPFLEEVLRTTLDEKVRNKAIRYLARSAKNLESSEKLQYVWELLESFWGKPYLSKEVLAVEMAYLTRAEKLPSSLVSSYWETLKSLYGESDLDPAILKALGHFSKAACLGDEEREEIVHFLLRELDSSPEGLGEEEEENEFFSYFLPAILESLKDWAISPYICSELRYRICQTLLEKWKLVKEWQLIWGPYNEAILAQFLVEIAGSEMVEPFWKAKILREVKSHLDKMYVLKPLETVMEKGREIPELGEVAAEMIRFLLRKKQRIGNFPEEVRPFVYRLLGILASHDYLGGEKFPASSLQRLVYQTLLEGIGQHIVGLDNYLEKMTYSKRMPEDLREKILTRLKNLRALRKV